MKKVLALLFIISASLAFFSSCEKDDICPGDTLTTPVLKLGFYNISAQDRFKSVAKLRVIGINEDGSQRDTLNTFPDRTSRTEISIPLRSSQSYTSFLFIKNSSDRIDTLDSGELETVELGNIDTLRFNYTRQEEFISRGCGYAVRITELGYNLNPDYTDTVPNNQEWITSVFVQDPNLQHQDTVHVKIYH
ncbi:DUF6452 family protein [Galbibacter sp.]|jgi:hypothetical protein|uniref:DUF6452 family protein n=1 Tax=Galbibacter sp. TaxID=2918471 RepID=UPI003A91C834